MAILCFIVPVDWSAAPKDLAAYCSSLSLSPLDTSEDASELGGSRLGLNRHTTVDVASRVGMRGSPWTPTGMSVLSSAPPERTIGLVSLRGGRLTQLTSTIAQSSSRSLSFTLKRALFRLSCGALSRPMARLACVAAD